MTREELLNIIEAEERNCIGEDGGELSRQRRLLMEYYLGQPYGNEAEGRSQIVTTEVADAVESMMPSLMEIFTSAEEIVRFEPEGEEDEAAARQTTDYVNYVFSRVNNGYVALYCAIKDALLQKNGFSKVYWDQFTDQGRESYENLTDDEFAMLLADPELELLEHTDQAGRAAKPAVQGQAGVVAASHSVTFRRTRESGRIVIAPLPPEEVRVSRETPNDLKQARFVEHVSKMSLSRLREMGFDVADDIADSEDAEFNSERVARLSHDDQGISPRHEGADPSTKEVWVAEAYLRVDYDGDGIAELRKVTKVGKTVLLNEEVDSIPIVCGTGIIMPHKLYGMSPGEQVMDLQLQKSVVTRNLLDNFYFINNGRYEVLENMVNMEDMLTNRPGGVVRSKVLGAVKRLDTPALGTPAYQLLQYLDTIKEARVGKRTFAPGPEAQLLKGTATGAEIFKSWDSERTLLIARTLAETYIKDLFGKILELSQKHVKKTQMIRLRNEWVKIDPREWTKKYNLVVTVGVGTGTQQQKLQGAMGILNIQGMMMERGLMGRTLTPENIYAAAREYAKVVFPKSADTFFANPRTLPPPPPPPVDPKIMLAAEKAKLSDAQKRDKMKIEFLLEQQRMGHELTLQEREFVSRSRLALSEMGHASSEAERDRGQERSEAMIGRVMEDEATMHERRAGATAPAGGMMKGNGGAGPPQIVVDQNEGLNALAEAILQLARTQGEVNQAILRFIGQPPAPPQ